MRFIMQSLFVTAVLCVTASAAYGQLLRPEGSIEIAGDLAHSDQLSGATFYRELLVVCPDEGASFDVLKKASASRYDVVSTIQLLDSDSAEIDMEGAAFDGEYVYIVGSHSLHRKTIDADRTYNKNRERLLDVEAHDDSFNLYRLTLDSGGNLSSKERINLRDLLKDDEILKPFCKIPSKENGVDIEGVATRDGRLFLGFRGPVLRGNYVPVMVLRFGQPSDYSLRFIDLGGRGIRDITAVDDGFLVLGGPIGDGEGAYKLFFWDGKDCIPGDGSPGGRIMPIGALPAEANAKPEGIAVIDEVRTAWHLLLLCDGNARPTRFMLSKP